MKFSFPSLEQITDTLLYVIKRFPLVVLVSLIGTVSAMWVAEVSFASQEEYPRMIAICFVSGLGISFLFAIATFLEQRTWNIIIKSIVKVLGLFLLLGYYFLIEGHLIGGPNEIWYRFFLLALGSHLLVSFAPFTSFENLDEFWEYNKALLLRILLSILYSGVLYAGLSIALLAVDNLLDLDIDGETYFQLFLFLGGIFNTWFFLAGVPDTESLNKHGLQFPVGLRVFVQYVLIPLVTVYILILYLYLGKIIIQWELPNGWVSNLVLSFSIAGIFSLLLLYPIRNSNEYKWVSFYSKFYYLALIPLIGLLMLSIWIRISEYGVTINRYFVATLGVWLTGIVIYFIISKTKSIKVIPISLCLITLAISFGPLGAFSVSERSQLGRFEEILTKNSLLNDINKYEKSADDMSFVDRKELSSVAFFIFENHGTESFKEYFGEESKGVIDTMSTASQLFDLMGLNFVTRWDNNDEVNEYFFLSSENTWATEVEGFDIYLRGIVLNPASDSIKTVETENSTWKISANKNESTLMIREEELGKSIEIDLNPIVADLRKNNFNKENNFTMPISELQHYFSNDGLEIKLYINSISGTYGNSVNLAIISLDILIKIK